MSFPSACEAMGENRTQYHESLGSCRSILDCRLFLSAVPLHSISISKGSGPAVKGDVTTTARHLTPDISAELVFQRLHLVPKHQPGTLANILIVFWIKRLPTAPWDQAVDPEH